MKQTLFLLVGLVWGITSCTTNDEDFWDQRAPREFKTSRFRSYNEALNIAKSAAKMVGDNTDKSRGVTTERTVDTKNGVKVVATPGSRSASPDTLMYVFNFADNEGFAVVSAVPEAEPLLAVTESGYYDPNEEQDNPGFTMYMDRAKEYVANSLSIGNPGNPSGPIWRNDTTELWETHIYSDSVTTQVGPLVNLKWGQRNFYGSLCPNGVAGCGAVAEGMIMAYFRAPSSIFFDYPENPLPGRRTINWNLVNNHIGLNECYDYNHQGDSLIAKILRQIGYENNANYKENATGMQPQIVLRNLHSIHGFQCTPLLDYRSYNYKTQLQSGKIGLVASYTYLNNNIVGHGFLLDGYRDISYKASIYMLYQVGGGVPNSGNTFSRFIREENRLSEYWHLNWGWDGECNGFYFSGVFDTSQCQDPDNQPSNLNYNFNYYPEFSFISR